MKTVLFLFFMRVRYVKCDFSQQKYLRWTVYLYITYIYIYIYISVKPHKDGNRK